MKTQFALVSLLTSMLMPLSAGALSSYTSVTSDSGGITANGSSVVTGDQSAEASVSTYIESSDDQGTATVRVTTVRDGVRNSTTTTHIVSIGEHTGYSTTSKKDVPRAFPGLPATSSSLRHGIPRRAYSRSSTSSRPEVTSTLQNAPVDASSSSVTYASSHAWFSNLFGRLWVRLFGWY